MKGFKERLFSISDTLNTKEIYLFGLRSYPKTRIFVKNWTVAKLNNQKMFLKEESKAAFLGFF